ncbi:SprT family zinc-dependent metalloprotease [Pseudidiomarina sp.]|uniref:M48 family metallopeptidase n=1 Tax=Pseudidiomarina sp. TaxID=2081707 RepID=UPI00299D967F|nr:SprT family zinc-dependent metalloprotease [Pseudidiomarina sp.]MDX1705353.1 SprT family zinc-dependent metalloprotease [Pseudidiomarina sp.]
MTLTYQVKRSRRRRSLAIKVARGEVMVQAPWRMPEAQIREFVELKRDWISRHLERQQHQLQALPERNWQSGEQIRWLGTPLTLVIHESTRKGCKRLGNELHVTITARSNPATEPQATIVRWYKDCAQLWLNEFFAVWPRANELNPVAWSVGSFTGKWGHCTRNAELKFSWKLWLAPEWVVRDVVIHELCHLREFNHSRRFWALVEQHSPDYQRAEAWLRQHGMTVLNPQFLDYVETGQGA